MDLQKLLKIIAATVGVVSISFLTIVISAGDEAIKAGSSSSTVNTYMFLAYFVLAVTVLLVITFTILNITSNASSFKSTLAFVGAFFLLAFICYFVLASGSEVTLKNGSTLTVNESKLVGAGLYLFYMLAFVAGGIMLFFGLKKSFNK